MNSYHEEEVLGKAYDKRLMKRLLAYAKPYWKWITVAIFILFSASIIELLGPQLTRIAIDHHIVPFLDRTAGTPSPAPAAPTFLTHISSRWLDPFVENYFPSLLGIAILFISLLFFTFLLQYAEELITQFVAQRVMFDMRMQVFRHLQELHLKFFDKNPVGRLMTRVTTDVETLNDMFSAGIVAIFGDIFALTGIVIFMMMEDWRLSLVAFSVLPLLIYATFLFRKKVQIVYREIRIRIARINAYLQENIVGMRVVQLFNREKKNFSQFETINAAHRQAHIRQVFYYAVFYPAIEIISALAVALILWYGGFRVLGSTLSIGSLVLFFQYAQRFFRPISDLSDKYNILQSTMASSERIFKLIDTENLVQDPSQAVLLPSVQGKIEFKNVRFAYNDEDWVLRDISFEVEPGSSVALVGATGAGKSSIISLLMRYYDIQSGEILLDGVNLHNLRMQDLRKNIAVVLQDVFLFSGTIEENIRLGNQEISAERIRWAAEQVNAQPFIENLKGKYQAEVKERGATFSVGQKQLLAFARALAFDPKILILDEATSSIDTETEQLIQQALARLMENRTSIVIAHRLSTIQHVDKIIVLHKGKIREMGSHQALLDQRGLYYKLYQLQYKEQELKAAS